MVMQRAVIVSLIFFSFGISLQAQSGYDTLPTMVEHYHKRYALFKSEPLSQGEIIFLGNSITEGSDWKKLLDSDQIVNRGIGGDVTYGILNRLEEIIRHKPAKIFILIGINDIAQRVPDEVILKNYKEIIKRITAQSPETEIVIQSLLPLNPEHPKFPKRYNEIERVKKLNIQIKTLTDAMGVKFLDLYPLFINASGLLNESLTYDGLHLNSEGYTRWADFLTAKGWLK
jgi:lysophospholipase L1-like esterase